MAPPIESEENALREHATKVVRSILGGRVIPFLGAGANLCGRPEGMTWSPGSEFLPTGGELTRHLAQEFRYPFESDDLLRVSQYVTIADGAGPLYEELHKLFDFDYKPTALHRFLAGIPAVMSAKGGPVNYPLIVTTNYDDLMETALREAGEPFDLVFYEAKGENIGKFWHQPPDGKAKLIETPNNYRGLMHGQRTIVLKIHGAVSRSQGSADLDSYVIAEDHYIDYLLNTDIASFLPVPLPLWLKQRHYLFLGYGLRDWNLRVILRRIWKDQTLNWKSWAVKRDSDLVDQQFWKQRNVDIIGVDLQDYIAHLARCLEDWPKAGGGA
jgi:hypothetical protein